MEVLQIFGLRDQEIDSWFANHEPLFLLWHVKLLFIRLSFDNSGKFKTKMTFVHLILDSTENRFTNLRLHNSITIT